MNNNTHSFSIRQHFHKALFLVFLVFCAALIWSGWKTFQSEKKRYQSNLPTTAEHVTQRLDLELHHIEKMVQLVGTAIAEEHPFKLQTVSTMLQRSIPLFSGHEKGNHITFLGWVDPQKNLLASSKRGLFNRPDDLSMRSHLDASQNTPWKLHFSRPSTGIKTQKWILPAGLGVTNEGNDFLGTLTMGISLEQLAITLENTIKSPSSHYLVLTNKHDVILYSHNPSHIKQTKNSAIFSAKKQFFKQESGLLQKPLLYEGSAFYYFKQLEDAPFIVLSGYQTSLLSRLFTSVFWSHLFIFALGLLAYLAVIFFYKKRIFSSLTELSETARSLAHGEKINVQESSISEIQALGTQFEKIASLIQKEKSLIRTLEDKTKALQRSEEEAAIARDFAEKINREKSYLFASLSHELRTPLNAIIGFSDVVKAEIYGPLNKEYADVISRIHRAGAHLNGMLTDILDLSKAEAGKLTLHEETFVIGDILSEIVSLCEQEASEKKITLVYDDKAFKKFLIKADPMRFRQIFMNLLSNSLKFTPTGKSITLDYSLSDTLTINVIDTGAGIKKEHIPIVLSEFGQVGASSQSQALKAEGTGLGLSIVKMLVDLHQGSLNIESEYGKGTTVSISFPLSRLKKGLKDDT